MVVRADAALEIGTGHVMRCLTLANSLRENGAKVSFICREHPGNLIDFIKKKKYEVYILPHTDDVCTNTDKEIISEEELRNIRWLGATQLKDAKECELILKNIKPDWLVVDHYSIDYLWHNYLRNYTKEIMVIDDLANRRFNCNLLLDQTYGRQAKDYKSLVPEKCQLLIGSGYALLRSEFAELRNYSVSRRKNPELKRILITLGGVDKDNVTSNILEVINNCDLPDYCCITIVMGATAPWINEVREHASSLKWSTEVLVNVSDMAQLMADSDLAIGAAGASSWERCCLGLPSLMVVLASNQNDIAYNLENAGCAIRIDVKNIQVLNSIFHELSIKKLKSLSASSLLVTDGKGVDNTVKHMLDY